MNSIKKKKRKALSFIEVVFSIFIVAIITTSALACIAYLRTSTAPIRDYAALESFLNVVVDKMNNDLADDVDITSIDYNAYFKDRYPAFHMNAFVASSKDVYGKPLYYAKINIETGALNTTLITRVLLRKGV